MTHLAVTHMHSFFDLAGGSRCAVVLMSHASVSACIQVVTLERGDGFVVVVSHSESQSILLGLQHSAEYGC